MQAEYREMNPEVVLGKPVENAYRLENSFVHAGKGDWRIVLRCPQGPVLIVLQISIRPSLLSGSFSFTLFCPEQTFS